MSTGEKPSQREVPDVFGMWSISTDEEHYNGIFATREEAIAEARTYDVPTYVGRCVPPVSPESLWCAQDWLERVWNDEDYCGDWADGAVSPTTEQCDELESQVRAVLAAWMDKHDLRPKHFNIDPLSVVRVDLFGS